MTHFSARLPPPYTTSDEGGSADCGGRLVAPYYFTGADYALVLSACSPQCVDLSLISWAATPLVPQLQSNLQVFCDAAISLQLADTPYSALHVALLQPSPRCVVAHLKVQQWLYSVSLRFAPLATHDAASLRVTHRSRQLGEPLLRRRRVEPVVAAAPHVTTNLLHADGLSCTSARATRPLSIEVVNQCAAAVTPLPAFTVVSPSQPGSSFDGVTGPEEAPHGPPSMPPRRPHHAGAGAEKKPWLNYSKPWLLPSINAAKARKAASEASEAKRELEERQRDPRFVAFATQSKNIVDQWCVSAEAAQGKRGRLQALKLDIMKDVVEGTPLNFAVYAARLKGCR